MKGHGQAIIIKYMHNQAAAQFKYSELRIKIH